MVDEEIDPENLEPDPIVEEMEVPIEGEEQ